MLKEAFRLMQEATAYGEQDYAFEDHVSDTTVTELFEILQDRGLTPPDESQLKQNVGDVYRVLAEADDSDVTLQSNAGKMLALGALFLGMLVVGLIMLKNRQTKNRVEKWGKEVDAMLKDWDAEVKEWGKELHKSENAWKSDPEFKKKVDEANAEMDKIFKKVELAEVHMSYIRSCEKSNGLNPLLSDISSEALTGLKKLDGLITKMERGFHETSPEATENSIVTEAETVRAKLAAVKDRIYTSKYWPKDVTSITSMGEFHNEIKESLQVKQFFLNTNIDNLIDPSRIFPSSENDAITRMIDTIQGKLSKMKKAQSTNRKFAKTTSDSLDTVLRAVNDLLAIRDMHCAFMTNMMRNMRIEKKALFAAFNKKGPEKDNDATTQQANVTLQGVGSFAYDPDGSLGSLLNEQTNTVFAGTDELTSNVVGGLERVKTLDNSLCMLNDIEGKVCSTGEVSRYQVESIVKAQGDFLPPSYPVKTFSEEPSGQNKDVFIASLRYKKSPVLNGIVNETGNLLEMVLKRYHSDSCASLRTAYEDGSMDATEALQSVSNYELIAAALFAKMDGVFPCSSIGKEVRDAFHPMITGPYVEAIIASRKQLGSTLKTLVSFSEDLLKAIATIQEKGYLDDVSVVDIPDPQRKLTVEEVNNSAYCALLSNLRESLADITTVELQESISVLELKSPLGDVSPSCYPDTLIQNVYGSEEWAEAIMASLTLDMHVPLAIIDSDAAVESAKANEIVENMKALKLQGRKPTYALAHEINVFSRAVADVSRMYIILEQHVAATMTIYAKLLTSRIAVTKVLCAQRELVDSGDVNTLVANIKTLLDK
jgi:hypothetical protein